MTVPEAPNELPGSAAAAKGFGKVNFVTWGMRVPINDIGFGRGTPAVLARTAKPYGWAALASVGNGIRCALGRLWLISWITERAWAGAKGAEQWHSRSVSVMVLADESSGSSTGIQGS